MYTQHMYTHTCVHTHIHMYTYTQLMCTQYTHRAHMYTHHVHIQHIYMYVYTTDNTHIYIQHIQHMTHTLYTHIHMHTTYTHSSHITHTHKHLRSKMKFTFYDLVFQPKFCSLGRRTVWCLWLQCFLCSQPFNNCSHHGLGSYEFYLPIMTNSRDGPT